MPIRNFGTTASGLTFPLATMVAVWNRGSVVPGYNPAVIRKDACGAIIRWDQYGQLTTFGWEIDHIHPTSRGGMDIPTNLQPLQWQNNRHKADAWPSWSCRVTFR